MATLNDLDVPVWRSPAPRAEKGKLHNESVSFTSSAGLNVSNRAVPTGKWWEVRTMRLTSAEVSKYYEFYADDGSTSHMTWHDPGFTTLPATASDPVGWV